MRSRTNLPSAFLDLENVDKDDRQFNSSIAKGFEVLQAFADGQTLLGNREIADRTGISKPTVSRLTYTLSRLGYLEFLPRFSKYQLGPGVLSLGYAFLRGYGIRNAAASHLTRLANELDVSVALGARDQLSIVYIDVQRGPSTLTLRLDVGSRLPVEASAAGLAYLAGLKDQERSFMENALEERHHTDWYSIRDAITKAKQEVSDRGYFAGLGLVERGINCVATPLAAPDGRTSYVLSATAPAYDMPAHRVFEMVGPQLLMTAQQIEEEWSKAGVYA